MPATMHSLNQNNVEKNRALLEKMKTFSLQISQSSNIHMTHVLYFICIFKYK